MGGDFRVNCRRYNAEMGGMLLRERWLQTESRQLMARLRRRKRNYFIVQHDLLSLKTLPNFIWNTVRRPTSFDRVKNGDRWVAYAYIKDESERKRCRLIVGFYECVESRQRRSVPLDEKTLIEQGYRTDQRAWMIEGEENGVQLARPISLPCRVRGLHPVESFLGRRIFTNATLIPIEENEFEDIRSFALEKQSRQG
jgi:hypothetical protein